MHTFDVVLVCAVIAIMVIAIAVLARQRYMMRIAGGQAVAVQVGGHRWIYGIGRYAGSELRWYRAIGVGTRPTKVLDRAQLRIIRHRKPDPAELNSLPVTVTIVECADGEGRATLAFEDNAFAGFVSWLEGSGPAPGIKGRR